MESEVNANLSKHYLIYTFIILALLQEKKMKYKLRYFYSKGAFLVLVWIMLITSAMTFLFRLLTDTGPINIYSHYKDPRLFLIPIFAFIPIAGWLADVRYGNFKVFKFGALLFFVSAVLACICQIMSIEKVHPTVTGITSTAAVLAEYLGCSACAVTAVQLGLDQMPDASSDNIISFIKWFIFSGIFGVWISEIILKCTVYCAFIDPNNTFIFFSLYPVLAVSILCCSIFLLAPKWLIIEPKSPQSLKTIYQVLKFAAKHKSPLNRSALTYWEEDIPSRMDLGKLRYGGPFTTEQVEDVKTFFKIIVVQIPLFFVSLSFHIHPNHLPLHALLNKCTASLMRVFTYHPFVGAMLVTLISEFVTYPLVKIKPPSILKQIGFACFIIVVANIGILIAEVVSYFHDIQTWIEITSSIISSVIHFFFLSNSILMFACAQSPYNMRGLLVGFAFLLHASSLGLGELLFSITVKLGDKCYYYIIYSSVMVVVTLFGFSLYCLLARWYKRRVRDEEYNVHRVVEEVYDRYLSNDMYH